MKKLFLLLFVSFLAFGASAQCLGEDCSIKGRNKAAKKKAMRVTGSKSAGKTYGGKKRKSSSGGFDPFSGKSSRKNSSGGFDPFAANDKKKKSKSGNGGYDPFASNSKKRKGASSGGYDPFAEGDKKRKSSSKGGYNPLATKSSKKGVPSGGYDGWDGSSKGSKPVPSGGIWKTKNSQSVAGTSKAKDTWTRQTASSRAGFIPPYKVQDDAPKSYDIYENINYSKDITYLKPHQYKVGLIGGGVLQLSDAMKQQVEGADLRPVLGVEFAIEYPTTGEKNWHHYFNLPTTGIGFSYLNLGNDDKLGQVIAAYPYINIPLIRSKELDFYVTGGAGLAYTNKYDKSTPENPDIQNYVLSSPVNFFTKTGLEIAYRPVTKVSSDQQNRQSRYTIFAGAAWNHISDGGVLKPDAGISTVTGSIGFKYAPMDITYPLRREADKLPRFYTFDIGLSGGAHELYRLDPHVYPVANGNIAIYRQVVDVYRLGLGADVFFDGAFLKEHPYTAGEDPNYDGLYDPTDKSVAWRAGVFLSNELVMGRTTADLDGGFYVMDKVKAPGESYYLRAALKYKFTDSVYGTLAVKTSGLKTDFASLGIGYSLFRW